VKRCTGPCSAVKPLSDFCVDRQKREGRASWCKSCAAARVRVYAQAHLEENRARARQWKQDNPDKVRANYERRLPEIVARDRQRRSANPEAFRARRRAAYWCRRRLRLAEGGPGPTDAYRRRLREQVFAHYGTSCACCGSSVRLTIDHVQGDGLEHRRVIGPGTSALYRWLIRNGFPDGFQTLCRPCNASKGRGSFCRLNHRALVAA
jgi:hypothetical protein